MRSSISLESVTTDMLGKCDRLVVGKDQQQLLLGRENVDALQARIAQIRAEATASDNKFDKEKAEEQWRPLVAVLPVPVGAATETELKDKKLRYTDALNSVRSAIEMVWCSGGATMLHMSCDEDLKKSILDACMEGVYENGQAVDEDMKLGVEIMFRSLLAPSNGAANAGLEGEVVADKCRYQPFGYGYNAAADTYNDLLLLAYSTLPRSPSTPLRTLRVLQLWYCQPKCLSLKSQRRILSLLLRIQTICKRRNSGYNE